MMMYWVLLATPENYLDQQTEKHTRIFQRNLKTNQNKQYIVK